MTLAKRDIQALARRIRAGDGRALGCLSRTRTLWRLRYNGVDLDVIYDKRHGNIATVLPENSAQVKAAVGR